MATAQERVGILVEVMGYEQSKEHLKDLQNEIKSLGRTNARIEFTSRVDELTQHITHLRSAIAKARTDIANGINVKGNKENIKKWSAEIANARSEVTRLKTAMKDIPVKSWGQQFSTTMRSVASRVKQLGSAMQTFGKAMQTMTGFGGRIMSGLLMGVGYRALNTITSGLSGALERSDTFKTYGKVIQAIMPKLTAEETAAGIERLNDAVLGLPTGLDEIVASQKMFTLATGDYAKAVDIAIASNNAFLASGASAEAKNTGERMLNTFLATGKLTAKQWQSIQRTMPSAMKAVSDEMGYADDAFGKFFNDLKGGKITVDEFTQSFIKVGTKGTIANAVEPMKETYSAILANWQNAIKRLGQNVLDTLSQTLEKSTGKNIYQWLLKVKDGIDAISQSIQNWIKANPDKIKGFIESISSIDWMGILRGIGQGLQWAADKLSYAIKTIGRLFGGGAEGFGRFLIKGNIYGKVIAVLGGFVRGLNPVIGAMVSLIKHAPFGKFLKVIMSPLAKIFGSFKKIGTGVETASPASAFAGASATANAATTALASFKTFALAVGKFALGLGAVAGTAGVIALVTKAIKVVVRDAKEIAEIAKGVDWASFGAVALTFATSMVLVGKAGSMIAASAPSIIIGVGAIGVIGAAISGFLVLDTWLWKKAIDNIQKATEGIKKTLETFEEIRVLADKTNASDFSALNGLGKVFARMAEFVKTAGENFYIGTTGNALGTLVNNSNVKKLKKIMKNLAEVFVSMAEISETLVNTKLPTNYNLKRIEDLTKSINETVTTLTDGLKDTFGELNTGKGQTKNLKTIMDNVSEVFNKLSNIVSTIDGFYTGLEKLFHTDSSFNRRTAANGYGSKEWNGKTYDEWTYTSIIEYTRENIHRLAVMIKSTFDALIETFTGEDAQIIDEYASAIVTSMSLDDTSKEYGSLGGILQKINEAFTALSNIVTTIDGFYASLDTLVGKKTENDGGHKVSKMSKVTDYIRRFARDLALLFEEINNAFSDEQLVSSVNAFGGMDVNAVATPNTMKSYASNSSDIFGKMSTALTAVSNIITTINNFSDELQTLITHTKTDASRSPLDMAREYIAKLANNLKILFAEINIAFEGFEGATVEAQFASIDKAFSSITSIVDKIVALSGKLPADGSISPTVTGIKNNITELGKIFGEGGVDGTVMAAQFDMVSVALSDFTAAMTGFTALAVDGGSFVVIANGLRDILTQAEALTNHLANKASQWGKAIAEALNAITPVIKGIGEEWRNALLDGFNSPLVTALISSALTSIALSINTSGFYSAGYSAGLSFASGARAAAGAGGGLASGLKNLLYRAKGGSVFKRRGTDTVPAMLTPGEYVMRKKAVSTFGADFMRRVNSLDIKGAMASLMMRGGSRVSKSYGSAIVNNTVNRTNNAKVTQNIYSNNPNFAYRRANRWVGAL